MQVFSFCEASKLFYSYFYIMSKLAGIPKPKGFAKIDIICDSNAINKSSASSDHRDSVTVINL